MNRDQKAAVIDEVAERIQSSSAIIAVDYRGLSVKQAVELRQQLSAAGARFQVVKNRLTVRAADKAGAEVLKEFLEGPTAFTYVDGDAAVAAKALATFRRQHGLLEFKGGTLEGTVLTVDQIEAIAKLPARDVLHGQFVGVLASPITGLVRGLASMVGGLASQLGQIRDQGLVGGAAEDAPAAEEAPAEAEAPAAEEAAAEAEAPAEAPAEAEEEEAPAETEETPAEEAPGDPVAEAETAEDDAEGEAEQTSGTSEAPSEGSQEPEEG